MVSFYDDFKQEWRKSCYIRLGIITAILIGLSMLIGGIYGTYYTPYTDTFSIIFEIGLLYCIAFAVIAIFLWTSYCRSEG